ncbi:iron-sulfur cluster carrier protein MrpORP [Nitratidesulfovibrio liaohensis]|uniref:Iron-sulfur cluster carrier protein n=1 Tax=Nitratidesulfovibrio liaohensis TaxID=2604158 RepID=A0ABY9QZC1_9BACT|nr:iron-sulfur cluster carrier protein MrpORP [Nitratidesulfovibrio liaohensis]WMW64854.1 P-loop NTPase [Nitratidesulfovibrio liaohensis]
MGTDTHEQEHRCGCGGAGCGGEQHVEATGGCTGSGCGGHGDHDAHGGHAANGSADGTETPVRMAGRVGAKLVVLSGKGGVGKSTVAVNLAVGLARTGRKVGLLDVDVHGPSVPRMLGLGRARPVAGEGWMAPVSAGPNLRVMSLGFFLPDPEVPVIWRGPVKMGMVRQFLVDVRWGDLDVLVVDCPPGTGDEPLSVLQLLGPDAHAVIVTTPQGVAVDDVRRSVGFCRQLRNPILGIVENMGGYVCPKCGELTPLFPAGGGEQLARETGVPFLGSIPLHPDLTSAGDAGHSLLETDLTGEREPVHPVIRAFQPVVGAAGAVCPNGEAGTAGRSAPGAPTNSNGGPASQGASDMKIAIPLAAGRLCQHFGHCEQFAVLTVDPGSGTVMGQELLTPPPHEPGVLPAWIADTGTRLVIAGGMGARARQLLEERGVQVLVGACAADPADLVAAWFGNRLELGANTCDH